MKSTQIYTAFPGRTERNEWTLVGLYVTDEVPEERDDPP